MRGSKKNYEQISIPVVQQELPYYGASERINPPSLNKAGDNPEKTDSDEKKKGFLVWLMQEPFSHSLAFVYLGVGGVQVIAFIAQLAGVYALCPYGLLGGFVVCILASHFYYTTGSLRDQIENMEVQIEEFKVENIRLEEQVQEFKEGLETFGDLQNQFKIWGLSNYVSMVSVAKRFVSLFNSLADVTKKHDEILLDNERMLLLKTAQDIEYSDMKSGLNREQFREFVSRIPARLKPSWAKLRNNTFEGLKTSSGTIPRVNLNIAIDKLIEYHSKIVREVNKKLRHMSIESIVDYREEEERLNLREPDSSFARRRQFVGNNSMYLVARAAVGARGRNQITTPLI